MKALNDRQLGLTTSDVVAHDYYHDSNYRNVRIFSLKGAKSRLVHLEKFGLNFSSSSFAICVNLFHP